MFHNASNASVIDHGERNSLPFTASAMIAPTSETSHKAAALPPVAHNERYSVPLLVSATTAAPIQEQAGFAYEYLTTDETARYLRCEPQTIRKNLSTKGSFHGLKPRRFGRRWYFKATEVRALLETA